MSEIVTTEAVAAAASAQWSSLWEQEAVPCPWGQTTGIMRHEFREQVLPAVRVAAPFIAEAVLLDVAQHVKDQDARETLFRAAFGYHEEQQP